MAYQLSLDLTSNFHGWFPSGCVSTFLRHAGMPLSLDLIDAALSLVHMHPVHPDFPQGVAVQAARILTVPISGDNCFFVSLHPSLYLIL